MKVSILTHELGTNYGGLLQNYALQVVLRELGHTPITLNYYIKTPLRIKLLSVAARVMARIKGRRLPLRGWPLPYEMNYIAQNTNRFIENNITKTERFDLLDSKKFRSLLTEAIIVGSDQVWRRNDLIQVFFLSYITDIIMPKIAYAASFGVDYWEYNPKETRLCARLLKNFTGISVREESGVDLCNKYLNSSAEFVLDPTLLINESYYEKLVEPLTINADDYLMVYILDENEEKKRIVQQVADQLGLKPHTVMAEKYFKQVGHEGLKQCVFPPVETWLQGFINAKYVLTDSFHGTVFSIIFRKNFISIVNKNRGAGRFTSLLKLLNLEDRLIESPDEISKVLHKSIDYNKVEEVLAKKREESISFLKSSLG